MKKIICILLVQALVIMNTGFADIGKTGKPTMPESVSIPKDMGTVVESHQGTNGKLVIHIQDAHCNYEAQTNIARILEHTIKKYGVDLACVEGADGVVDTAWFKNFPDAKTCKEAADHFMKKGKLTGAEFLSITKNYPFTMYGVEDRELYAKNYVSFLESYPHKESFKSFCADVKGALRQLKRYIYTKELAELDSAVTRHEEEKTELAEYVAYLKDLSASCSVDIGTYSNLKLLTESLRLEKEIDFDAANSERESFLEENVGKNSAPPAEKYPNFARYMNYLRVYESIDTRKLFDEIDILVRALKEGMFANSDQRVLDTLWTDINIMIGIADAAIVNKDYAYYLANKDNFDPESFTDFINEKAADLGLAINVENPPQDFRHTFRNLINFYMFGVERDKALVKNMINGMRGKRTDRAVLITGGFHTEGIKKLLEKDGYSYAVVAPLITKDAESPYIRILTGQNTDSLTAPLLSDKNIRKALKSVPMSAEAEAMVDTVLKENDKDMRQITGADAEPAAPAEEQSKDTEKPGGAVKADGSALTSEQKAEVDAAIRQAFKDGTAKKIDEVNGVKIYEIPGLAGLPYLVAHPGRGGDACNHEARNIYLSPERNTWLNTLSVDAYNQFIAHEIAHLDNHRLDEEAVQKIAPINKVLAEIAVQEALAKLNEENPVITDEDRELIKQVAYGIASYLEGEFRSENIAFGVYTGSLPVCAENVADWLTNRGITEVTKIGLRKAIKDERWADLAGSYDKKRPTFGTAGIRTSVAKTEDELEALAKGADEGHGFEVPILRGPSTINPEIVKIFTLAMLRWKMQQSGADNPREIKVAIARDSRIAGREFADLIRKICLNFGVTVYIADEPMPLPEFSLAIKNHDLDFGLYISASHNPKISNGLKIIGLKGAQMGADPVARKEVMKAFNETTPNEAQAYLDNFQESAVAQDQVKIMGGKEKLPDGEADFEYGEHEILDIHGEFTEAVGEKIDKEIIKKNGDKVKLGYCGFYGTGTKAMMRLLKFLGIKNFDPKRDTVNEMNRLDGGFPGLKVPDPALAPGWRTATGMHAAQIGWEEVADTDLYLANDPDADRAGIVARVGKEEIPESEEVAEAMGIIFSLDDLVKEGKLTQEQRDKHKYGGFKTFPANEWGAMIAKSDFEKLKEEGGGEIQNKDKYIVATSHVTSGLIPKMAEDYGLESVNLQVGVDRLAQLIADLEDTPGLLRQFADRPLEEYADAASRVAGLQNDLDYILTLFAPVGTYRLVDKSMLGKAEELIENLKRVQKLIRPEGAVEISEEALDESEVLIEECRGMADQVFERYLIDGVEESGTLATGKHIRDKDGFQACAKAYSIACALVEDGKTLNDFLNDIYLEYGLFATTNFFMEFADNIPGRTRRIEVLQWFKDVLFEEAVRRADPENDEPLLEVAGHKIYGADMQKEFRSGKYDDDTFEGFPDAGIRLYLDPEHNTYITIRPSGTEPKIRVYGQFYNGSVIDKDYATLAEAKEESYAADMEVTKAIMTITKVGNMETVGTLARVHGVKDKPGTAVVSKEDGSKLEHLGIVGNRAIARLTLNSIEGKFTHEDLSALTNGRPYRLLVRKRTLIDVEKPGSLEVSSPDWDGPKELSAKYGDAIEVTAGTFSISMGEAPDDESVGVEAYIEYEPSNEEAIVDAGVSTMKALDPDGKKPVVVHMPKAMYSKAEEDRFEDNSNGAVTLEPYGNGMPGSLHGLQNKTFDDGKTHVFIMFQDDLESIRNEEDCKNVLQERILPVEGADVFRTEVIAAGAALGFTEEEDLQGEELTGQALDLQNLISLLRDNPVSAADLNFLINAQAENRIDNLITRLLIPVHAVSGEIQDLIKSRRLLQWAV